jgi:hypothetical protein
MKFLQFPMLQSGNRPGTNWRAISGPISIRDIKYQNGYYLRTRTFNALFSGTTRRLYFAWSTDALTWTEITINGTKSTLSNNLDIATDGTNIFTHYFSTFSQLRTFSAYAIDGTLVSTTTYSTGSVLNIDTRTDGKTLGILPYEFATFTAPTSVTFNSSSNDFQGRAVNIGSTSIILSYSGGPYLYVDGTTNGTSLNLTQGLATFMPNTLGALAYNAFNPNTALAQCVVLSNVSTEFGESYYNIYTADITVSAGTLSFTLRNTWQTFTLNDGYGNPIISAFVVHPLTGDLFVVLTDTSNTYLLRSMDGGISWQVVRQEVIDSLIYTPLGLMLAAGGNLYVSP